MKYPTLFQGIGKLRGVEVKLHIDKRVNPVAQQPKKFHFTSAKKWKQSYKAWKKGIIERVYGPNPWVSPLVITPKKNGEVSDTPYLQ